MSSVTRAGGDVRGGALRSMRASKTFEPSAIVCDFTWRPPAASRMENHVRAAQAEPISRTYSVMRQRLMPIVASLLLFPALAPATGAVQWRCGADQNGVWSCHDVGEKPSATPDAAPAATGPALHHKLRTNDPHRRRHPRGRHHSRMPGKQHRSTSAGHFARPRPPHPLRREPRPALHRSSTCMVIRRKPSTRSIPCAAMPWPSTTSSDSPRIPSPTT
jgi:hypothetical protein